MIKKMLVLLAILILCASSVLAVDLTDSNPIDGSEIYTNIINFEVIGNESITSAFVWVDNGAWTQYNMPCIADVCSLAQDVSGWTDYQNYSYYFTADGNNRPTFPLTYTFFLDRPPSQVTGLTTTGVSDSEIQLDWFANSESDIQTYNVYASLSTPVLAVPGNLIGLTSSVTYTHSGLSTGQTWFYVVTAEDNNVEGVASLEANETVQDFTPPVEPVITPPSGSTVPTTNPTIAIDYTAGTDASVIVTITSGAVDIASFSGSNTYNWNPTLVEGVSHHYTIESCDTNSNCRTTSYSVMAEKDLSFNSTVVTEQYVDYSDMVQLIGITVGDGTGYFLYQVNLESFGADVTSFRPFMLDFSGITSIFINEDSQPIAFCGADLVGNDISATPTYGTYNMDNTFDLAQSGLDCPQEGLTSIYESRHIFKIPVPLGTLPGIYGSGYAYYWSWS